MKQIAPLTVAALVGLTSLACGGGSAPPPSEDEATREGVFGSSPVAFQGVPSTIMLRPTAGDPVPVPEGPAVLDQLSLTFMPKELVVRAGQMVLFANSESLAHNVHVWWMENDSSIYFADMDPGDRYELLLEREGAYDITCDEHPGMRAVIYVTSAPYATFAAPNGDFEMSDVPPGSYTAQVWSAPTGLSAEVPVVVSAGGTEVDLTGGQ